MDGRELRINSRKRLTMATEKKNIIAEIQKGVNHVEKNTVKESDVIVYIPNWLTAIVEKQTQITRLPNEEMKMICGKKVLPNYQMSYVIIADVNNRNGNFYIIELNE